MPLVPKNDIPANAPKLYGVGGEQNTLLFRERLMKLFKASDYVTVKNIDTEDVFWQAVPQDGETEQFSEDGTQRQIYRQQPEQWYIPAGGTDVLIGANAYLALDVIYKQFAAHSVYRNQGEGKPGQRNFNLSDASLHNNVIAEAYLGKATPVFGPTAEQFKTTQPQITPVTPTPSSDNDIPLPSTAPNGQPAPEVDTGDSAGETPSSRAWPEPKKSDKEPASVGSAKR